MKYTITHSCGHTVDINLFGSIKERERQEAYMAKQPCPECRHNKAVANQVDSMSKYYELQTVSYVDYKTKHQNRKSLSNSYDSMAKTIKIWLPKPETPELIHALLDDAKLIKDMQSHHDFCKLVIDLGLNIDNLNQKYLGSQKH